MAFDLKVHRDVEKQLRRVSKNQRERLIVTMRSLRDDPRPTGCVKLDTNLYRVRQGQYRVIYAVFDKYVVIVICKIARRAEDTYRDLKAFMKRAGILLD